MQVKITRPTVIAGEIANVDEVVEVSKSDAQFLIRTNKAVAVEVEAVVETSAENTPPNTDPAQLSDIKGISEARLETLVHHGVTTLQQLIDADPTELAPKISGVGEATFKQWQAAAEQLAASN